MSRTTRRIKHRWYSKTLTDKIDVDVEYWSRRPYDNVKKKKPKEVYEAELAAAQKDYETRLKETGGFVKVKSWVTGEFRYVAIRKPWVSKHYYIEVPVSKEEIIDRATKEFNSYSRDGKLSDSGRKTGFKKEAAKTVRRLNKKFCKDVLVDEWEDDPYPNGHEGDTLIWNWF